jgi:hypothetical protein
MFRLWQLENEELVVVNTIAPERIRQSSPIYKDTEHLQVKNEG